MMKPDGEFIGSVGSVLKPIPCICEQSADSFADFMVGNADILFAASIHPGPFPGLIKHPFMDLSKVWLLQRIMSLEIVGGECPCVSLENVLPFPFVQFFFGAEIGN